MLTHLTGDRYSPQISLSKKGNLFIHIIPVWGEDTDMVGLSAQKKMKSHQYSTLLSSVLVSFSSSLLYYK